MPQPETVEQVFEEMTQSFRSDEAQGLDNTFQFHISGDDGGAWHAHVEWERCEIERGEIDEPDVTVSISAADWIAIATGRLNPETAYMTGKLKAEGDLGLATKIQPLFF